MDPQHDLAALRLLTLDSALVIDTYIANLKGEVEHANARLQRINDALEHRVAERTRELEEQARRDPLTACCAGTTLSLGLAQTGPERYDDPDTLIDRADRKMYQAKRTAGFQIRR